MSVYVYREVILLFFGIFKKRVKAYEPGVSQLVNRQRNLKIWCNTEAISTNFSLKFLSLISLKLLSHYRVLLFYYIIFFQLFPQNSKHRQKTKTTVKILPKKSAVLSNKKFQPVELQTWNHINYKLAVASSLHFQSYRSRTWGRLNINFLPSVRAIEFFPELESVPF